MQTEDTTQLHSLNNLLALATGSNLELANQIRSAIDFALEEGVPNDSAYRSLTRSAEHLLQLHLSNERSCGFQHCDFSQEHDEPLFIRQKILSVLHQLAGCQDAILLISGLKQVGFPGGKLKTRKRKMRYHQLVEDIELLAAKHSSPRTHLKLIFI